MKFTSCPHSFALFELCFILLQFASALSIDSKAIANLQPRLDGDAVVPDATSSSASTRRRKKCSFTPPVPSVAFSTDAVVALPSGFPTTTVDAGTAPNKNTSTLGNQLTYARSYKTTCSKKTGTVYLPSASSQPVGGQAVDSGSSGSGSGPPDSSESAGSSVPGNGASGSAGNGEVQAQAATSGQSVAGAGSPSVCGQQQTVTVTTQTTVTVTQVAQEASSSGPSPDTPANSPQGSGSTASAASIVEPENTSYGSPTMNVQPAASASASNGPSGSKFTAGDASCTTVAGEQSGDHNLGSDSPGSNSGNTGSSPSVPASGAASSGTSTPGAVSGPGPYDNTTASEAATPSESVSPIVPVSMSNSTNVTSNAKLIGQFWAGATLGTVMRMEAIPERVFYDYDGKTVKDPFKTLGDAGVNSIRIEGSRGQCLGPTQFINNGSTLGEELLFTLDWGCIDIQVQSAQRGVAQGMRVVLTINQGFDIPEGMESYSYAQMVDEVQKESKRQLQPFLDAKIVPDVILFENEGSDGFLFTDIATGHIRGSDDGKAPKTQVDKEKCGQIPTGNLNSFPQYAGYLKAEVLACNEAITAAGFSTASVRYGLHSHGQYVQWKESLFHGPRPASQTELKDTAGNTCSNSVIPAEILSANASELITIMGFSAYPDPMTPTDINSEASENDTFNRTLTTLTQMMGYAEAYGKYESGPFAGEYKLQALGVEYGTSYTHDQIPQEQQETEMMWSLVKQFPNVLGMMWYEPWYCHGDWEGGNAALCHKIDSKEISGQAPTDTLKTWAAAAVSPWKT